LFLKICFLKIVFLSPNKKIGKMKQAEIHTSKGVMKLNFYEEDAPIAVANFV